MSYQLQTASCVSTTVSSRFGAELASLAWDHLFLLTLTYAAASSAEAVLTVSLTGSNLSITAVARGTATVTVAATDPDGAATSSATTDIGDLAEHAADVTERRSNR